MRSFEKREGERVIFSLATHIKFLAAIVDGEIHVRARSEGVNGHAYLSGVGGEWDVGPDVAVFGENPGRVFRRAAGFEREIFTRNRGLRERAGAKQQREK